MLVKPAESLDKVRLSMEMILEELFDQKVERYRSLLERYGHETLTIHFCVQESCIERLRKALQDAYYKCITEKEMSFVSKKMYAYLETIDASYDNAEYKLLGK